MLRSVHSLHRLLVKASDLGASDIDFQTEFPVFFNLYGIHQPVTKDGEKMEIGATMEHLRHETLLPEEIRFIANHFFRGAAAQEEMHRTRGGLNVAYVVEEDHPIGHERRGKKHRFRINMVQGQNSNSETNVQITARPLPGMVKFPEEYGIPQEILDHFFHTRGIVLVTGPTGSGKTTLLASILRDWLERSHHSLKLITGEDPIEIVLQDVIVQMIESGKVPNCIVHHAEVPTNLRDFALFIREAMRRHPDAALIGELRDLESISAAIELVLTGHLVLSTTHTIGVPATIDRMISGFPTEEKLMKKQDLIYSLRLIVSQLLVRTTEGKLTAIREYLPFTAVVRKKLLATSIEDLYLVLMELLQEHGRPFILDVRDRYEAGIISEETYRTLEAEHALA